MAATPPEFMLRKRKTPARRIPVVKVDPQSSDGSDAEWTPAAEFSGTQNSRS